MLGGVGRIPPPNPRTLQGSQFSGSGSTKKNYGKEGGEWGLLGAKVGLHYRFEVDGHTGFRLECLIGGKHTCRVADERKKKKRFYSRSVG